jgi:hypothetical protein
LEENKQKDQTISSCWACNSFDWIFLALFQLYYIDIHVQSMISKGGSSIGAPGAPLPGFEKNYIFFQYVHYHNFYKTTF